MTSLLRCNTKVWIAVKSETTGDAGEHQGDARSRGAERRTDQVGDHDCDETTDERHHAGVDRPASRGRLAADSEDDRCAEPRARGDSEQVWIHERVAEHALVTGPGQRQHRPDDPRQRNPRHPYVPDDVPVRRGDPPRRADHHAENNRDERKAATAPTIHHLRRVGAGVRPPVSRDTRLRAHRRRRERPLT